MTNYVKEFDKWNIKKKDTDAKILTENLYFYQREVWWCAVGVNIGVEIDGKSDDFVRPVLVVKKFNGEMFWGIPLTSKKKPHLLRLGHDKGVSYANLSQLRVMSTKRLFHKVGMVSEESFQCVREKLVGVLIPNLNNL
jgi:mRNA interferase MazF